MIKELTIKDYEKIREIHHLPFDIPKGPLVFSSKGIFNESGKLQVAGFLKLTSEGILIIDENLPKITRARLISTLLSDMTEVLKVFGIDDIHTFLLCDEEKTEKFLNHFNFVPAKGKAMYYHG